MAEKRRSYLRRKSPGRQQERSMQVIAKTGNPHQILENELYFYIEKKSHEKDRKCLFRRQIFIHDLHVDESVQLHTRTESL